MTSAEIEPTEHSGMFSSGVFIEMDTVPTSPEQVLELFVDNGKYQGMLSPEEVETIRNQIPETASDDDPFGFNILVSPNPNEEGCFVEVQYFKSKVKEE